MTLVVRLILAFTCIVLAACNSGSGGGGADDPTIPPDGMFPPGGISYTMSIHLRSEHEPNDTLAMAEALSMPEFEPDTDYVGTVVRGNISDTIDMQDHFLFTASRDHMFTVQLCPSSCAPFGIGGEIDTSVAYFEVLDQSGVLLKSSQGDLIAGNSQEVSITAGLVYYVGVFAEDTVGATQDYYLEVLEKPSVSFP